MEKLKCSFPTSCKQNYPQFNEIASYTHSHNAEYAKVEVTVQNGEITDIIILEHRHEHGKAAETVINEIVDEQRIDVDAVSGATNSSIVIKKAVENALKSGL